ncbi:MAG: RraA family protein [Desertimonas sp.]
MSSTATTDADWGFLRSVDSPTVANAIERFAIRDRSVGYLGGPIRCAFPELGVMAGRALTVTVSNSIGAVAGRAGWWRMWEALDAMDGPVVLAFADASGEPHRVAYAGEIMARVARRLGAVGMVTDGALRDVDEVRALGFHYFMQYPVVSHANFEIVAVGDPVTLWGQRVATGDILHGDVNGVVIVPPETLATLPAEVDAVRTAEAAEMAFIESDDFSLATYQARHGYGSPPP